MAKPQAKKSTIPFNMTNSKPDSWVIICASGLALVVLALVAYFPVLSAGFIWDDDYYVTQNALLPSPDGLWRIWTEPKASPQYYPLVFTTFWLEYRFWQLQPFGYHL